MITVKRSARPVDDSGERDARLVGDPDQPGPRLRPARAAGSRTARPRTGAPASSAPAAATRARRRRSGRRCRRRRRRWPPTSRGSRLACRGRRARTASARHRARRPPRRSGRPSPTAPGAGRPPGGRGRRRRARRRRRAAARGPASADRCGARAPASATAAAPAIGMPCSRLNVPIRRVPTRATVGQPARAAARVGACSQGSAGWPSRSTGSERRDDDAWLAARWADPRTRVCTCGDGRVETGGDRPRWCSSRRTRPTTCACCSASTPTTSRTSRSSVRPGTAPRGRRRRVARRCASWRRAAGRPRRGLSPCTRSGWRTGTRRTAAARAAVRPDRRGAGGHVRRCPD